MEQQEQQSGPPLCLKGCGFFGCVAAERDGGGRGAWRGPSVLRTVTLCA